MTHPLVEAAVVHEISAWTGKPEDETPICGADKNDPFVFLKRTVYTSHVTCPDCQHMREAWAELHDNKPSLVFEERSEQ